MADAELRSGIDREDTGAVWVGLEHGAMRELTNSEGFTPLLYFCSIGDYEAIEHLIHMRHAEYLGREKDGWDCLMFSAYHGDVDTVSLLLRLPHINALGSVPDARHIASDNRQYQAQAMLDDYMIDNDIDRM